MVVEGSRAGPLCRGWLWCRGSTHRLRGARLAGWSWLGGAEVRATTGAGTKPVQAEGVGGLRCGSEWGPDKASWPNLATPKSREEGPVVFELNV
eukprot:3569527-Amphidinium_carterae.1